MSIKQNIIQQHKEIKCWYILQHGRTLKTSRCVKETSNKRAYVVFLHLHEMCKIGKFTETENISVVPTDGGDDKWDIWG